LILGTGLNLILDPIMIYGWLGCPAMGIRGAAWRPLSRKPLQRFGCCTC
jgi:hypothetical protein